MMESARGAREDDPTTVVDTVIRGVAPPAKKERRGVRYEM